MWKTHKRTLLLTSAVILLPAVLGLIFWNKLPESVPVHWRLDGEADGFGKRFVFVAGIPLVFLALQWLGAFLTGKDPRNEKQSRKVSGMVLWILPMLSLAVNGLLYATVFQRMDNPMLYTLLLIGAMFAVLGNYMPKCRQNSTVGVKIRWTLANEENWNATHRVTGKVWFGVGILMMACALLPMKAGLAVMISALVVAMAVPVLYSWLYARKQMREDGVVFTSPVQSKAAKASLIPVVLALVIASTMMFSGKVEVTFGEEAFTVEASMTRTITVAYSDVEAVEYRGEDNAGQRVFGVAGARLLTGSYMNEEFGNYTRYSYTACKSCVVVTLDSGILVLNGPDAESTEAIYETLSEKTK